MAKKQRNYRLSKENAYYLNREFYEKYDPHFLRNKARVLMAVVNKLEDFKKLLEDPEDSSPVEMDEKFINSLRAEIHFTAFHQYECLFALLFAAYQDLPHWLFLSTYRQDVEEKVQAFLDGDIEKVTDGKERDLYPFLHQAVYAGLVPSEMQEGDAWKENLDMVHWLLERIAQKFSGEEYNAYKHGLRVMIVGETRLTLTPVEDLDAAVHWSAKDTVTFLEVIKETESDLEISYSVRETAKHFDAYESLIYLENMAMLLKSIRNTRYARLTGKVPVVLSVFSEINKEELLKLSPRLLSFSRTFQNEVGDELRI